MELLAEVDVTEEDDFSFFLEPDFIEADPYRGLGGNRLAVEQGGRKLLCRVSTS